MTLPPTPQPAPLYRGPLRWMNGVPSLQELAEMAGLFVGAALLLLLAWRLVRRYIRSQWNGLSDTSAWQVGGAAASALAGSVLLWLLWLQLDHVATRMGVGVGVVVLLLMSELRSGSRSRRRYT
jgi:hypothetical protein